MNSGVAVGDKAELVNNIFDPFLDTVLTFTDEGVFFKVTVNLHGLKRAEAGVATYVPVVPQTSRLSRRR